MQLWGVQEIVLTHVIQFGYAQGGAMAYEQDYKNWLEKCALPLRESGLDAITLIRTSGTPASEILVAAKEVNADLIILGSRSQNVISKLFLGSVAREVIRTSTLPVLLEWIEHTTEATRSRCEAVCTDTLRHVIMATDFSRSASAAEKAAIALAPQAGKIEFLHVMSEAEKVETPALPIMTNAALNALAESAKAAGGNVEVTLLEGNVPSVISEMANNKMHHLLLSANMDKTG